MRVLVFAVVAALLASVMTGCPSVVPTQKIWVYELPLSRAWKLKIPSDIVIPEYGEVTLPIVSSRSIELFQSNQQLMVRTEAKQLKAVYIGGNFENNRYQEITLDMRGPMFSM